MYIYVRGCTYGTLATLRKAKYVVNSPNKNGITKQRNPKRICYANKTHHPSANGSNLPETPPPKKGLESRLIQTIVVLWCIIWSISSATSTSPL